MTDFEASDEGYWGLSHGLPVAERLIAELADKS